MATDTITVLPNRATATQIVSAGDGATLVTNTSLTLTVYLGDTDTIRATDSKGIVPLPPNGSVSVDGNSNLFAVNGNTAPVTIATLSGGVSNFLGITQGGGSLAIPSIFSPNYVPGLSGWSVDSNGNAEFNSLLIPAPVIGTTGANLNPNPFFTGGYGADWHGYLGTFTVVPNASAPGGAPGPFVGHYNGSPGGVAYESGGTFGVIGGTPVIINAVVFNPTGSTVYIGLNAGGAVMNTVPVSPGNWTAVQTVINVPAGVNTAWVQVGLDPAHTDTDLYFWGVTVQGQVPGGAIQANSISANQIIAGIVIAGIINGTIVNAATFNGSLFNGTDFMINSNGAFFYSGTPAAGNLLFSIANAAGTDPHGNTYLEGIYVGNASNGPQVALIPSAGGPSNPAELAFPFSSFFSKSPVIQSLAPSSTGQWNFNGPALAQSGFNDWVQLSLFSFTGGGATPAFLEGNYIDVNGIFHQMFVMSFYGMQLLCSQLNGVHPGTGTSQSNAAQSESWQTPALQNGFAGHAVPGGVRYRYSPEFGGSLYIEVDVRSTSASGTVTIASIASAYASLFTQQRNFAAMNSAAGVWGWYDGAGNIQAINYPSGNEIAFSGYIPLN